MTNTDLYLRESKHSMLRTYKEPGSHYDLVFVYLGYHRVRLVLPSQLHLYHQRHATAVNVKFMCPINQVILNRGNFSGGFYCAKLFLLSNTVTNYNKTLSLFLEEENTQSILFMVVSRGVCLQLARLKSGFG